MERLRGPINSFMSSECIDYSQISFLQMLDRAAAQSEEEMEEEGGGDEEEYKQQLHFQIHHQHCLLPESNMQLLFKIHNHQNRIQPSKLATESCVGGVGPTRKKRKRARQPPTLPAKNKEEAESQRMNHIAVERYRRKLMNCHLTSLRSLMPESYVQRGDQASIIGGAIDFVKELEQLLLSLQAKKRSAAMMMMMMTSSSPSQSSSCTNNADSELACHVAAAAPVNEFFVSPQYTGYSGYQWGCCGSHRDGLDVEATMVQGHVNLKVLGRKVRKRGQLVRAIAALEEIGLCVLHLNITSLDACSILYSLNLKMEEGCKVGTADEVAAAVRQIFTYITACSSDPSIHI